MKMNKPRKYLYPKFCFNDDGGKVPYDIYEKYKSSPVGTRLHFPIRPPGYGTFIEEITQHTKKGFYTKSVMEDVWELTIADVI
jgi:hypothetical protein